MTSTTDAEGHKDTNEQFERNFGADFAEATAADDVFGDGELNGTSQRLSTLLGDEDLSPDQRGDDVSDEEENPWAGEESTLPPAQADGSSISSPASSLPGSRLSFRSGASPSPRPFERRFVARLGSRSPISSPASPAFATPGSRQVSGSSYFSFKADEDEKQEDERRPWEVVRWTRLRKVSQQAFSESGKRAFGRPTFLSIGASIAIGTSKGIILLFDYQQTLKSIIGQGTSAAECGSITALAISADHTTVAGGHENGTIFTWDISRPAKPFLHIEPMSRTSLASRSGDGHVLDSKVLHLAFLGQRHTALVSADDSGMAFSHVASRGMGPLGRTVRTTRVLGRYPDSKIQNRKPSSVLAFAALPLGNVEQAIDEFGLTALLTPYLLVVVSTMPIAQTQFKMPRVKDVAAHSAMTGCLAWFPSVKLRDRSTKSTSQPKLVYCWSNVLSVLEVHERDSSNSNDVEKRPELDFKSCGQWTSEEAILAVQWLSRSIIAVLTITQQLVILDGADLHIVDTSDLNPKHIFHQDLFSRQLQPLVDKVESGDGMLHGVLPDAYHMSFRAYKGRLFLLGVNDVSMGTLSNWAERLVAMMDTGDPIAAIRLATSYYTGAGDTLIVGLPQDDSRRHDLVRDKVLDLLSSSLEYILSDDAFQETEPDLRSVLEAFSQASFTACTTMEQTDFLFDVLYERLSDASMQDMFLYELETYVLDKRIDNIPPNVFKDLLIWYESHDFGERLEAIICTLQTDSMDIDQVSGVCKRLNLFDALIYVWNAALDDFITPLVDLLAIIRTLRQSPDEDDQEEIVTSKIFPYLAYTLSGRRYPSGEDMSFRQSFKAKSSIYDFIFSPRRMRWPRPDGPFIALAEGDRSYPYLQFLLHFDTLSFLSMLNEAFEDNHLNGGQDPEIQISSDGTNGENPSASISRERIVNILLEVIAPPAFEPGQKVMLDIFLARNLAKFKFSQFIRLSGSTMHRILVELCHNPMETFAEECQLSVEYLLTVYSPADVDELTSMLQRAKYFRVLKSTYRTSKQYSNWLECFFEDKDDQDAVFAAIGDCLRPNADLNKRQVADVKALLKNHLKDLIEIDTKQSAETLAAYAPELLDPALNLLQDGYLRYAFLSTLFAKNISTDAAWVRSKHHEDYVSLMCTHDPRRVTAYVSTLATASLKLEVILPAMEKGGVVDAAVILLQHEGLVQQAMERLIRHLANLRAALGGMLKPSDDSADIDHNVAQEALEDILNELGKYAKLGIWLCREGASNIPSGKPPKRQVSIPFTEDVISPLEKLWLDLLEAVINLHGALPRAMSMSKEPGNKSTSFADLSLTRLRVMVQSAFTAVLTVSSNSSLTKGPTKDSTSPSVGKNGTFRTPRFPAILETLLARLAKSTDVQSSSAVLPVLSNLFKSYAFEQSILTLAQQFTDRDVFALVHELDTSRSKGWRPRSRNCEGCGRRCWGPGVGEAVYDAWDKADHERSLQSLARFGHNATAAKGHQQSDASSRNASLSSSAGKGKMRAGEHETGQDAARGELLPGTTPASPVVVFARCGHCWHSGCLPAAAAMAAAATAAPTVDEQALEHEHGAAKTGRGPCPACHRP